MSFYNFIEDERRKHVDHGGNQIGTQIGLLYSWYQEKHARSRKEAETNQQGGFERGDGYGDLWQETEKKKVEVEIETLWLKTSEQIAVCVKTRGRSVKHLEFEEWESPIPMDADNRIGWYQ